MTWLAEEGAMMDTQEVLRELQSQKCRCGKSKKAWRSFCYGCFKQLSYPLQRALYKRFGEGYEEAYRSAIAELFNDAIRGEKP